MEKPQEIRRPEGPDDRQGNSSPRLPKESRPPFGLQMYRVYVGGDLLRAEGSLLSLYDFRLSNGKRGAAPPNCHLAKRIWLEVGLTSIWGRFTLGPPDYFPTLLETGR